MKKIIVHLNSMNKWTQLMDFHTKSQIIKLLILNTRKKMLSQKTSWKSHTENRILLLLTLGHLYWSMIQKLVNIILWIFLVLKLYIHLLTQEYLSVSHFVSLLIASSDISINDSSTYLTCFPFHRRSQNIICTESAFMEFNLWKEYFYNSIF